MLGRLGLALIALVCALPAEAGTRWPALLKATAQQYPGCPGEGRASTAPLAIDMSQPATGAMLQTAWRAGVRTIIRYYDWDDPGGELHAQQCSFTGPTAFNRQFEFGWRPGPTFRGKMLAADERDLILSKGFGLGIVFQHCNQYLAAFQDKRRGSYDGRRVLAMAHDLGQPRGTTIFFGVDADLSDAALGDVERYFRDVRAKVVKAGYRVGVYGNGYMCARLQHDKLASACWLSQSTAHQGSLDYEQGGAWTIKQCATRQPFEGSDAAFDPDIINPKAEAIGLWRAK